MQMHTYPDIVAPEPLTGSSPRSWGCFWDVAYLACTSAVFPTLVGVFPLCSTYGAFIATTQPTTQPPNQMRILYGILSTALLVNLVAMALDTGHPSVWVIILCAVVIIFAGGGKGVSGT